MKKITIVLLILLVLGIVSGCIYFVMRPVDIVYVSDSDMVTSSGKSYIVKRLYSSGVDAGKVEQLLSSTYSTAFTDEEIQKAALLAGTPEFYPWFYFNVSKSDSENGNIKITAQVNQDLATGQIDAQYISSNLMLEGVATNLTISDKSRGVGISGGVESEYNVPVFADDGSSFAAFIDEAGIYEIYLSGTSGTVMLQYTYDIKRTDLLFPSTALQDQLMIVYITVTDDGTKLDVSFEQVACSQVSDMY